MIAYFKHRNTLQLPAVLALTIALKIWFVAASPMHPHYFDAGGLLAPFLNKLVAGTASSGFFAVVGLFFLLGSILYANYITSNRRMFAHRHSLVATCMLLITSLFPAGNLYLPALIVLPISIAIFDQITSLYHTGSPKSTIINAGILAGIGYLLFHPFIFLFPAFFIGLAYMRPFKISEWILLLLGMATPIYFLLSYEYLTDNWAPHHHLLQPKFEPFQWEFSTYWWIMTIATLLWLFISVVGWQRQSRRMLIQGRKNWYFLLMMGLFSLPGLILPLGNAPGMMMLISFPLGSMLANSFSSDAKTKSQTFLFWFILILVIIAYWAWKLGHL